MYMLGYWDTPREKTGLWQQPNMFSLFNFDKKKKYIASSMQNLTSIKKSYSSIQVDIIEWVKWFLIWNKLGQGSWPLTCAFLSLLLCLFSVLHHLQGPLFGLKLLLGILLCIVLDIYANNQISLKFEFLFTVKINHQNQKQNYQMLQEKNWFVVWTWVPLKTDKRVFFKIKDVGR